MGTVILRPVLCCWIVFGGRLLRGFETLVCLDQSVRINWFQRFAYSETERFCPRAQFW